MAPFCVLCALVGAAMLIIALARIVPELLIESPLDLLWSFLTSHPENNFFALVRRHIREGWPYTQPVAILLYGGLTLLLVPVILCFVFQELMSLFAGSPPNP